MALPTLSVEQRQAALEKAAESRRYRSEVLGRLKAGGITFADLLERAATDTVIGKTKVVTALRSIAGVGAVRAAQLMTDAEIMENRRLSGLGVRQRQALLDALT